MPLWAICALAVLAVPRAVAHDLELAGRGVNALLVFAPLVVWIAVALYRRVPDPFLTLLAVGAVYGLLLAVTHQVLWTEAFDGDRPGLGGELEGRLTPAAETAVLRTFAFMSSLVTGVLVGAATGALAWLAARLLPGRRPR
jgi:hypothetical protein